jgi:RNA polymerase sigma factor (sigma-70 family)
VRTDAYRRIGIPSQGSSLPVNEWLDSPYLSRAARRVAWQYGLSAEDSSDLLQELSLALWKAGPDTRINATWIFHTAAHKAIDILRQRRAASLPIDDNVSTAPERQAELLHLLHARVDGLPKHLREFYALRFEQGLSQRETAAELGLLRGSVRCLDRKCIRQIRRALGHRHGQTTMIDTHAFGRAGRRDAPKGSELGHK